MKRLADTLTDVEAELLRDTLRYVKIDTQVDTLDDNLVKPEV